MKARTRIGAFGGAHGEQPRKARHPVVALCLVTLSVVGCGKKASEGALTQEDVERLVDQRLAAVGLAPAGSASSSASSPARQKAPTDPVADSIAFLARLDELMKDYKPDLPAIEDKSDVLRCVTSDAAKTNPEVSKIVSAMKGQSDAAKEDRRRREREFYDTAYPLAFHFDLDWATRKSKPVAAQYWCFNVTYGKWTGSNINQEKCANNPYSGVADFEWRVRVAARPAVFLYSNSDATPTQPPELMRRLETAGVRVPKRLACRVEDVVAEHDRRTIKCHTGGLTYEIRTYGDLAAINVGDVVSASVADTRHDPDGVLYKAVGSKSSAWIVEADAAAIKVDSAASCPTIDEMRTAGGVGASPSVSASVSPSAAPSGGAR